MGESAAERKQRLLALRKAAELASQPERDASDQTSTPPETAVPEPEQECVLYNGLCLASAEVDIHNMKDSVTAEPLQLLAVEMYWLDHYSACCQQNFWTSN